MKRKTTRRRRAAAKPQLSIEDLIQDPEAGDYFKALIYGAPGVGKTHLIGTGELDDRLAPILVLSFEGGQRTLVGSGVKIIQIDSWDKFNLVYAWLSQELHDFKTVAIDSLSETHMFALLTILEREGKDRRNPDLIDLEDYNTGAVQIRRTVRHFRDLPMHFIATATEQTDTEPRRGRVIRPNMVGKLAKELPGVFDNVLYLAFAETETKKGEEPQEVRALFLKGDSHLEAKVRAPFDVPEGKIPQYLVNPELGHVLDVLGF